MACAECGRDLDPPAGTGRPRRYCSRSCQSRAYRRRRDDGRLVGTAPAAPRPAQGSSTALDHPARAGSSTRDDLLLVAVTLADDGGVGAVTLRAVAHRAGVPLAAVRRELGSRDRLLAALVQRLLAPRQPRLNQPSLNQAPLKQSLLNQFAPPQAGTPVEALTRLANQEWSAYREHPWLVAVLASSRPPLVPAVLDAARASTEAFVALGVDPPSALGRYLALSGYVQGMALLLLAEHDESARGTDYRTWWSAEARRLDRSGARRRHPWLDDVTGGSPPDAFDADVDAWFRDGLARVLAGLTTP